jgi:hypothetical protein
MRRLVESVELLGVFLAAAVVLVCYPAVPPAWNALVNVGTDGRRLDLPTCMVCGKVGRLHEHRCERCFRQERSLVAEMRSWGLLTPAAYSSVAAELPRRSME